MSLHLLTKHLRQATSRLLRIRFNRNAFTGRFSSSVSGFEKFPLAQYRCLMCVCVRVCVPSQYLETKVCQLGLRLLLAPPLIKLLSLSACQSLRFLGMLHVYSLLHNCLADLVPVTSPARRPCCCSKSFLQFQQAFQHICTHKRCMNC